MTPKGVQAVVNLLDNPLNHLQVYREFPTLPASHDTDYKAVPKECQLTSGSLNLPTLYVSFFKTARLFSYTLLYCKCTSVFRS